MFNTEKYLMTIKGKQYLPVNARIAWLRTEHQNYDIKTEMLHIDEGKAITEVVNSLRQIPK